MRSKICILVLLLLTAGVLSGAEYKRPEFDKSKHKGTLWTQVNPWFPVNKSRNMPALGGPNYARKVFSGTNNVYDKEAWKVAILECEKYGMTGWQFELVAQAPGFADTLKRILKGAEELKTDFKFAIMLGLYAGKTYEQKKGYLFRQFKRFKKEFQTHPNIYRIDGAPVIAVYTPFCLKPEQWKKLIPEFEKEFGRCIWLMNFKGFWDRFKGAENVEKALLEYIPCFDGITAYGNWTLAHQTNIYKYLPKLMKRFPDKIFEGCAHNAYSCHFYHGGVRTRLSEKIRKCWDSLKEAKVDSVVMTNFFDVWENSLIFPCYERNDFMLRYAQYRMHDIFGNPFPKAKKPEIILTNYIDMIPGSKPLDFEIITLPADVKNKNMEVGLDIYSDSGRLLHSFPAKKIRLDKYNVLEYTMPNDMIYDVRAVVPRIVGKYNNKEYEGDFNPPTILDPSIQTSMMFWAHSTNSSLRAADGHWTMNDTVPGGTLDWNKYSGTVQIKSFINIPGGKTARVRVMRNGFELYNFENRKPTFSYVLQLPHPGKALNYYWLEVENANGERFRTFPIWVTANTRPGKTAFTFKNGDKCIEKEIETVRIPSFEYPCDIDTGALLMDVSGYNHHGVVNRNGKVHYCFGSLGHTGYYHVHNNFWNVKPSPVFQRDSNGRGFLNFDSKEKNFYMISGGSAMPYNGTYEMEFYPIPNGNIMYLVGTPNNQINIWLDKNNFLHVLRKSAAEGFGAAKAVSQPNIHLVSKTAVKPEMWHKLRVSYSIKEIYLELDGKVQQSMKLKFMPSKDYESINHLAIASRCGFLHNPGHFFNGRIRNIRITGGFEK